MKSILLLLLLVCHPPAYSQTGAWSSTGPLVVPRAYQKSVVLNDGKVLVSGGYGGVAGMGHDYLTQCEVFDPGNGLWSLTDSLTTKRYFHTMTLLRDGRVLVAGGAYASGNRFYHLESCELWDPLTEKWTVVSPLNYPRGGHTATLLANGKVLVAGGNYFDGSNDRYLNSCELYDPELDQWILTDSMSIPRKDHTATILPNGDVLAVSGQYAISYPHVNYLTSCEVFNQSTETWSVSDSLSVAQSGHRSVVLANGNILVTGGYYSIGTCEVFNPTVMAWSNTGSLRIGRDRHSVTALPGGSVLALGGGGLEKTCELYIPERQTWVQTDSLPYDISNHSAELLRNGKVLLSGGYSYDGGGFLAQCLLFDPNLASNADPASEELRTFALYQNYPNPFNASTLIQFSLQIPSQVSLKIFDLLGREVGSILSGFKDTGPHTVQWDATRQPSGVYFYRLRAGEFVETRKLVLVR